MADERRGEVKRARKRAHGIRREREKRGRIVVVEEEEEEEKEGW
jgi:hypothetical protein